MDGCPWYALVRPGAPWCPGALVPGARHFHIHKRPQKGCLWMVKLFLDKEIRFFVEVPGTKLELIKTI
jgi:hypothetical protein